MILLIVTKIHVDNNAILLTTIMQTKIFMLFPSNFSAKSFVFSDELKTHNKIN